MWLCQCLDFGFLTSGAVKEYIYVLFSHQVCGNFLLLETNMTSNQGKERGNQGKFPGGWLSGRVRTNYIVFQYKSCIMSFAAGKPLNLYHKGLHWPFVALLCTTVYLPGASNIRASGGKLTPNTGACHSYFISLKEVESAARFHLSGCWGIQFQSSLGLFLVPENGEMFEVLCTCWVAQNVRLTQSQQIPSLFKSI